MLAGNKIAINSFKAGDLVLLPVDGHDLGAADAPNLECVILEKIGDMQFRLGHITGILKECLTYNVLTKISDKSSTLTIDKVPKDKTVSVREAVKGVSIAGGQGVKKCLCAKGDCSGKKGKCSCASSNVPCNSRCHGGNPNPKCTRPHTPLEATSSQTTSSAATTSKSIFTNNGKKNKKTK